MLPSLLKLFCAAWDSRDLRHGYRPQGEGEGVGGRRKGVGTVGVRGGRGGEMEGEGREGAGGGGRVRFHVVAVLCPCL